MMMDEAFLPWWVVVLLGMWSISLTVWQHPSIHREVRLWAGLLSLIYLVLMFLALGAGIRSSISEQGQLVQVPLSHFGLGLCGLLSLSASVWLLGRISRASRQLCYVVVTLANAAMCAVLQGSVISIGLLIVAAIAAAPLFAKGASHLEWRKVWSELLQFEVKSNAIEPFGKSWLIGGLTMLLACVFLGTCAYTLRYEAVREHGASRTTVLPARAQLDALLFSGEAATAQPPSREQHNYSEPDAIANPADPRPGQPSLLSYVAASRADIVVLMAVIVFLALASNRSQQESSEIVDVPRNNSNRAAHP